MLRVCSTSATSPFIQSAVKSYTPGTTINITLPNSVFGLLIYARQSDGTHVGTWTANAAQGTQLITCSGELAPRYVTPDGSTLCHTTQVAKKNMKLTWQAPDVAVGNITFQGLFTNGAYQIYLFRELTLMPAPGSVTSSTGGVTPTTAPRNTTSGFTSGPYTCTWVITSDRQYIDVTMTGQTKGWVSWGVSIGPLMENNADYCE